MTVSVQVPEDQLVGNGTTTLFSFNFEITADSDLVCYLGSVVQTQNLNYTVTTFSDTGGTITFTTAPASGVVITITRALPLSRAVDYQPNGAFDATDVNSDFDRLWLALQQQQLQLTGSITIPAFDTPATLILPTATNRASTFLYFDPSGNVTVASAVASGVPVSPAMLPVVAAQTVASALVDLGAPSLAGPNDFTGANNETFTTLASAATVDIGAANANYIEISGSTTITAFDTVQSGTERTVVFNGALTLTYNSTSLILPGNANITTAAKDTAIFRSEGSGNWRCISYTPTTGLPVVAPTLIGTRHLRIVQATATTLAVTADEIIVKPALGGTPAIIAGLNVTLNIGNTGVNGMDTGGTTANADLSVYAIGGFGKTAGVIATLGSTSNGTIYSGSNIPSGYTQSSLIGSVKMNSSGQFNGFIQIERTVSIGSTSAGSTFSSSNYAAVSLSSIIPANAISASGDAENPSGYVLYIASSGSLTSAGVGETIIAGSGGGGLWEALLTAVQTIYYRISGGSNANIQVSSYTF